VRADYRCSGWVLEPVSAMPGHTKVATKPLTAHGSRRPAHPTAQCSLPLLVAAALCPLPSALRPPRWQVTVVSCVDLNGAFPIAVLRAAATKPVLLIARARRLKEVQDKQLWKKPPAWVSEKSMEAAGGHEDLFGA
jgi:hypothetical protein